MCLDMPELLRGTEYCLVAYVPAAGARWQQVHFNLEVVRVFFRLEPGGQRSITLEKIGPTGERISRKSRQLVFSERSNRNVKVEMDFGDKLDYPPPPERPIVVVVEAGVSTYRYRSLMPGDPGHSEMKKLISAGPSVGKGLERRIVTLDEVESYWPGAALRGAI